MNQKTLQLTTPTTITTKYLSSRFASGDVEQLEAPITSPVVTSTNTQQRGCLNHSAMIQTLLSDSFPIASLLGGGDAVHSNLVEIITRAH